MTTAINSAMTLKEWALLILLSVLWGGSFFLIGVAVGELAPLTIVTLRLALGAAALWLMALAMGLRPPRSIKTWLALLVMGLLNNAIPFTLIVWGQTQIASGLASILNATTPLFAVIVAGLFLPDERATPLKMIGVILGFIGVTVMLGLPTEAAQTGLLPQLAIVAAALCYACAGVYGRRFKALSIAPITLAAGQVTASTLLMMPVMIAVDGPVAVTDASTKVWLAVIALGLISTAVAYVLYFKLLASAGATNLMLVTLLVPVSAILLGSLFLNESLQLPHFIGMGLIALGLSAIDGRLWRRVL